MAILFSVRLDVRSTNALDHDALARGLPDTPARIKLGWPLAYVSRLLTLVGQNPGFRTAEAREDPFGL